VPIARNQDALFSELLSVSILPSAVLRESKGNVKTLNDDGTHESTYIARESFQICHWYIRVSAQEQARRG